MYVICLYVTLLAVDSGTASSCHSVRRFVSETVGGRPTQLLILQTPVQMIWKGLLLQKPFHITSMVMEAAQMNSLKKKGGGGASTDKWLALIYISAGEQILDSLFLCLTTVHSSHTSQYYSVCVFTIHDLSLMGRKGPVRYVYTVRVFFLSLVPLLDILAHLGRLCNFHWSCLKAHFLSYTDYE